MSRPHVFGETAAALGSAGLAAAEIGALEDQVLAMADRALPASSRIDAHVHLGRDSDGHTLDADGLVADLDVAGIGRAVCFAPNDPGPHGDFRAANDLVLGAAARHPSRIVPFARVDPRRGAVAEIARASSLGARGLKLHPVAQRFPPEGEECVAVVRAAGERGWPVVIHAGFGARPLAAPIAALLAAVPAARLVLAHGGRGDAMALGALAREREGLYFDTSLASLVDLVGLPPERLLFGSDRPYGEHATALHLVALARRLSGWGDGEAAAVLSGNALALLGEES